MQSAQVLKWRCWGNTVIYGNLQELPGSGLLLLQCDVLKGCHVLSRIDFEETGRSVLVLIVMDSIKLEGVVQEGEGKRWSSDAYAAIRKQELPTLISSLYQKSRIGGPSDELAQAGMQ